MGGRRLIDSLGVLMENKTSSRKGSREDIFDRLKAAKSKYYYKVYEAKILKSLLENKLNGGFQNAGFLRRELEKLEFRIATEALNLKQEREFVKEIRHLESNLKKAEEREKIERKLHFIEEDSKKITEEMEALKKELEMAGEVRKKPVKSEVRVEHLPSVKSNDGKVSLGDICVIKKKD